MRKEDILLMGYIATEQQKRRNIEQTRIFNHSLWVFFGSEIALFYFAASLWCSDSYLIVWIGIFLLIIGVPSIFFIWFAVSSSLIEKVK
jgi:hypothetical protein